MTKILNLVDSHIKGVNSANRLGNYLEDSLSKLREVVELSKTCDFVIHSGDLTDSPNLALPIIDDIIDIIESGKKNWYIVPGNHDMCGTTWENSKSCALQHMVRRSKYIHILNELDLEDCYIKGHPYYFEVEEDIKKNGLICKETDKFKIAITHAFISIKPFLEQVLHVQAKDIETNFDLVGCSHFHTYFNEVINNTRFLNPGEIGRLSITEAKDTPQVAIIDTSTREAEIIKLKSAKEGKDIFDLSKAKEIKEYDKNMGNFISALQSTKTKELNIKNMVTQICKEHEVEDEIKNIILEELGE